MKLPQASHKPGWEICGNYIKSQRGSAEGKGENAKLFSCSKRISFIDALLREYRFDGPDTCMKTLLIDNHTLFRDGLRHILQQLYGKVGEILEAGSFSDGLKLAKQNPDLTLALLELKTPGSEGAISIKLFRQLYPHIPVVVVSSEEDCHVINNALSYGASGFVCKSSPVPILLGALNLALSGSIYVPEQLLRKRDMTVRREDCSNDNLRSNSNEYGLTVRQVHILKCLAAGFSNKEIAGLANLSEGTVKAHVAAVYQALRVKNRMEAAQVAWQLGFDNKSYA